MTPKEQEIAIGELEERVDRLRNIYEQYFLGFEKLEPTVPRKDVDRRLAILRKEQIRNTAMRFRFQVVTQKYNTYAMHWVRICRQIEEGTYKRHVRKAKARFGDLSRGADPDISVEIDMGDFDGIDMDEVLADADAAVARYEREAPDTVPPPAPARAPEPASERRAREIEPSTPPPSVRSIPDRAARGAALPAGTRPLILRKRDETEPPPSQRSGAASPASQQSGAALPGSGSQPTVPGALPSSQRRVQGAPHSAPHLRPMGSAAASFGAEGPGGRPSAPRIQRSPQPGGPAPGTAGPPAAGRIPVAAPASGASAGRIPIAPPASAPGVPAARPAHPASMNRLPAPPPAPSRPDAARSAPNQPNVPSVPGAKAEPPPPRSVPRLPPTTMPRPLPAQPSPRAPMPVGDAIPPGSDPRQNARPRAPLPLPSQGQGPGSTKKE